MLKKIRKEKKILYTKNMVILKLILKVFTAGIETFVVSGNKFYKPVSKNSAACEINHVLVTSINSSLLLNRCNPNQFFR
jgi:hypothetical protein